ncbi:MAG: ABC transporter permease [Actinomycetia bacterium]|nr:ABC transporter permease [Actinomycetes bacterium]
MSHALSDTWTLAVRTLKHNLRSADTIVTVLVMPLMILLAFVFVLGGAMNTGQGKYVNFVVPVVLLMCIASGVAYTSYRINLDITTGIFARFRTMPIARTALVGGHVLASVIANAASVVVILGIALAIGYRPHPTGAGWGISLGLLLSSVVAFSAVGVAFGVLAKSNEGAGMFSYILMALLFVSSGFAPTSTMPAGLRAFADHQPLTPIINAIRNAQLGAPLGNDGWLALGWLLVITIVFAVLAGVGQRSVATRHL